MRVNFKLAALVLAPIACFGLIPFSPANAGSAGTGPVETGAPVSVRMIGDTEKVCQLTGDVDWDTGHPTAARTFSNFGLDACDLGYPVEHNGKLIILFGDSWPPPHGGGPAGEILPDDAVGMTTRAAPPNKEDGRCLELTVHHTPPKKFAPAAIVGPTHVKQGFFNVPSGGVSVGGSLYAFFWTNHCSDPNKLAPSPGNPLVRPPASGGCPETDDRNSVGRGVLARSDDDGRSFSNVVPMPTGFVYATAVNTGPQPDVPADERLGVFIFAAPRYRASVPYLAYAPVQSFADTATWRFFTGPGPNGQPTWVSRDEWNRGRPVPAGSFRPPWSPVGQPELFTPKVEEGNSVGELSVTYNHVLHMWLMLYGGPGGMLARVARAPWGPWSDPTRILGGEDWLPCHLVMSPNGCGNRRDYWPDGHKNGKFVGGGLYAPYVLNRYTTGGGVGAPGGSSCTIYWVVSTWNPYQVSVMRTTLQLEEGGGPRSGGEAQAGWRALEEEFTIPGEPGFFLDLPRGTAGARTAAIWPHGQGIAAALDLAELSGNYSTANQMLSTIDAYRYGDAYTPYPHEKPQTSGEPPKRWYDDDGHVGLDLMQAYAQTGQRIYLDKAKSLFNFIKTGQHPEGGVLWCDESDPTSTAMSATGSDTESALRLYLATRDQEYLRFAEKNYRYMQEHFLVTRQGEGLPVGLYWGQVGSVGCPKGPPPSPNGRADKHSYNQGYPIAIDAFFYRITGDAKYLANAARTAAVALDYWSGDRLWQDAPAFNSIFFRDLLALDLVAPNPAYRKALDRYLDEVWNRARNPRTGLFDQGGIGHYGPTAGNYLDQASLVELFALKEWPRQALERVAFMGSSGPLPPQR